MVKQFVFLCCALSAACSATNTSGTAPRSAEAASCAGGVAQNDAELRRYEGCREIKGDLLVRNVTSVAPLAALEHLDGSLRIEHTERLYSLTGLEHLKSARELVLRDNAGLICAGALSGLARADHVHIADNPRLSRAYGLMPALARSGASVDLNNNLGLEAEGVEAFRALGAATTLAER
jgi:hypothetical protein